MAYAGIIKLDVSRKNQDFFTEVLVKEIGPYDVAVADNPLFAIDGQRPTSVLVKDVNAQACTVYVRGCNQETLHPTNPLTGNRLILVDTLTITSGGQDEYHSDIPWRWLVFTQSAAAAKAACTRFDICQRDRM